MAARKPKDSLNPRGSWALKKPERNWRTDPLSFEKGLLPRLLDLAEIYDSEEELNDDIRKARELAQRQYQDEVNKCKKMLMSIYEKGIDAAALALELKPEFDALN